MAKKVNISSQKKTVNVRNMPIDLWRRLSNYLDRTGRKQYVVVAQAVREFLDREESK